MLVGGIVDVTTRYRMMVVAVHAAQFYVFAVNLEDLADAFHALYAEVIFKRFIVLDVLSIKLHGERIEPGLLGRPQAR